MRRRRRRREERRASDSNTGYLSIDVMYPGIMFFDSWLSLDRMFLESSHSNTKYFSIVKGVRMTDEQASLEVSESRE